MAYSTQTDMGYRWSSLVFWADADQDGTADAAIVAAAIAWADSEINRCACQQYVTPLTLSDASTAAVIQDASIVLAGFKLATRANDRASLEAMDDEVKGVRAFLARLRDGKETLPGESLATPSKPSGEVIAVGDEGTFTHDTMDGL